VATRVIAVIGAGAFRRRHIERATFVFTLLTLGRSSVHRLYLAGAVGGGLAWAIGGVFWTVARQGAAALTSPSPTTLQMQLILTLLLVTAVRFSVTVPVTLAANWLFRVTERQPSSRYHAGTRWAALTVGLIPVVVLSPVHVSMWGWPVAAYHGLVGACYAAFIVELLFGVQTKVPFAAPYVSGGIRLKTRWPLYVFGASVLTAGPAAVEHLTLASGWPAWLLPGTLVGLATVLMISRRHREKQYPGLAFKEEPLDAIQTLSIFDYAGQ
jgi:hypothetical protein